MNFVQAMIVPSLVTMGMGSLLVAQHLSFAEVGYAAPANGKPLAVPQSAGGAVVSAPISSSDDDLQRRLSEFPGPGSGVQVVKATSENELSAKAVETAGREDPFLRLIPPTPGEVPLPEERPVAPKLPPVSYVPPPAALPPLAPQGPPPVPVLPPTLQAFAPPAGVGAGPGVSKPRPLPVVPAAPAAPASGGKAAAPATPPKPFGGDKAPPPEQPQWMVRGIISTGYERICMLEGRAGNNISARVGDSLSDGSQIEAISNRGVTFIRGGRRFVKIIGGIL